MPPTGAEMKQGIGHPCFLVSGRCRGLPGRISGAERLARERTEKAPEGALKGEKSG
jgi:hypothetical protein